MQSFITPLHTLASSRDGSPTAYSREYGEHYHSTKDGAVRESLHKHVLPAFAHVREKKEVAILDICFGLGFNTLATVLHYSRHAPQTKLRIHSPELDTRLIASLKEFHYPEIFHPLLGIVETLAKKGCYESENLRIELFLGDARTYVRRFHKEFDIVYQDAFSPSVNPLLWTEEYFGDIARAIKDDALLTTYSTALKTRLALHRNGFEVYLAHAPDVRDFTLASLKPLQQGERVDMQHKISCNPDIEPLTDTEVAKTLST